MDIINKLNKKGNVTMEDILYHGSKMIVSEPEIRKSRFTKDFSLGSFIVQIEGNKLKFGQFVIAKQDTSVFINFIREMI